jgi:hypothetical protein
MGCGCNKKRNLSSAKPSLSAEKSGSDLTGSWVIDNKDRKLLVISPIYDSYNDIIGYITKDESQNTVRIFSKNIKTTL